MAPRKKCAWSPRKMKIAVKAVQDGAKLRQTAALYNVPVMTLSDYVKQSRNCRTIKFNRMGRKPVFTEQQENDIKEHILGLSKQFYGLTPHSLKTSVYEYAQQIKIKNPFNKDLKEAGKDWLYGFLKRNPEVSIRRPEATSINRILAFNSQEVKLYFDNLSLSMTKYKFPPHRIYNVDETGINSVHRPGKILAQKGLKQVGAATSWERGKNITICCCVSATGQYIPPMIIYPRRRMQAHLEMGGPSGCIYRCSKSGWMNEELFQDWVIHFKEHVGATQENPVLLILDNHSSHISLSIYNYCRENGIHMVTLPPHTSHRTQPLDLTVFGPLKNALHQECQTYMNTHNYEKLMPLQLIPLFTTAFLKIANAEKAVNGFKAAGIWPLNPNVFEQLTEEGNDEPTNEYISAEEVVNVELEPRGGAMDDPYDAQPGTSGLNNPIHFEEEVEQEIIIYSEPTEQETSLDIPILSDKCTEQKIDDRTSCEASEDETGCARRQVTFKPCDSPSILHLSEEEKAKNHPDSVPTEDYVYLSLQTTTKEPKKKSIKKDVERVKRKILMSPESGSSCHVTFSTISPMPNKNKNQEKGKGQGKRSKQHSTILTSTPMKALLENKAHNRMLKNEKEEIKKQLKISNKAKRASKNPIQERAKKQKLKSKTYSTSSSEVDENVLCNDDDDNDGQFYDEEQQGIDELCVICGEFGKNRELWFRCVSCGKWAHALCSGENSANNYLCAFCE